MTPEQKQEITNLLHAFKVGLLMNVPRGEETFLLLIGQVIHQAEDAAWDAARRVYLKSDWPMGAQYEVPVYDDINDWRKARKLEGGV